MTDPSPAPDQSAEEDLVASPCVSVCTMDRTVGLCVGCLRTIQEIGAWRTMTMDEKRACVAACAARAATIAPRGKDWKPLPPGG